MSFYDLDNPEDIGLLEVELEAEMEFFAQEWAASSDEDDDSVVAKYSDGSLVDLAELEEIQRSNGEL